MLGLLFFQEPMEALNTSSSTEGSHSVVGEWCIGMSCTDAYALRGLRSELPSCKWIWRCQERQARISLESGPVGALPEGYHTESFCVLWSVSSGKGV